MLQKLKYKIECIVNTSNYRWNINDINAKMKYVQERMKNPVSQEEYNRLHLTLIHYLNMLDNSGRIRYTGIYNLYDKIFQQKFSVERLQQTVKVESKLLFKEPCKTSEEYIQLLIDMASKLSRKKIEEDFDIPKEFPKINLLENQLVQINKDFYGNLGDSEIFQYIEKIFDLQSNYINFSNIKRTGQNSIAGSCFSDYIFNKAYVSLVKSGTLFDCQVLAHEVMHGVDFYFRQKMFGEYYWGFSEVPTYTIQLLLYDFLKEKNFDSKQIEKLRNFQYVMASYLSKLTLNKIKKRLIEEGRIEASYSLYAKDVINGITLRELDLLKSIQSYVLSYGLFLQINNNKNAGISNLKYFMKNPLPNNQIPNFSSIGLGNQTLIQLSDRLSQSFLTINHNNIEQSVCPDNIIYDKKLNLFLKK